ncbi:MAG: NAD(P)H-binding protein [Pseudomonadota bacterium]
MTRQALLFGATGLIGSHLLQMLLDDGRFEVTAATRKPLALQHPRLRNVVTDFSSLDASQWPAQADIAFSCLGTTLKQAGGKAGFHAVDHDLVLRCAGWAKQLGVSHFLAVSAIGVSRKSPVYYNRVKAETEADLAALGFPQLTLMQPSLLLGERGGPSRPGEAVAIRLSPLIGPLMIGPLSPYTPVQAADVARAMLTRAAQPSRARIERLRYRDMMALAR